MAEIYRVIVGLGNPGARYDGTRHNIGFAVVDALKACSGLADPSELRSQALGNASRAISGSLSSLGWQDRGGYLEASCSLGKSSTTLIKPMTFMNLSGEPLQSFLSFRKIPITEVIVVHDEIDIPFGAVRVKVDGGEGGHNGLRSISERCGGRGYARVRVGVGKPPAGSPLAAQPDGVANWVLSRFSSEESPFAEELVAKSAQAVFDLLTKGVRATQNKYNVTT